MKYFTVSGGHANRKVEHKLAHCGVSRGTSGASEPLHDNDRLTHINRDLHNVLEADTVRTSTDFIFPKTVPPRKLTIDLVSSASR